MVCLFTPELQNLVEGDNNMTFRSPKIDNFLSREVILCQKDTCSSWTIFCPALTKFCQVRLLRVTKYWHAPLEKGFPSRRHVLAYARFDQLMERFHTHTHVHTPSKAKKLAFHT